MLSLHDIQAARERIADHLYVSPCARSETFSRRCEAHAFFKLENLQMTGSFKERGALNKILQLAEAEIERGVVAASAGNHAQAVAYHASKAGVRASIVMPHRTPLIKVANTRAYGAEVILAGDNFDEAYAVAREKEEQERSTFLHPFDDEQVIAGQGTLALELVEQVPDLEVVIAPVGGGGLIAGLGIALKALLPKSTLIGVQAAAAPAMQRSLQAGRSTVVPLRDTIADGIAVKQPGRMTLEYVQRYVDDMVCVDEEEIANAILLLLEQEKTVVEGAGAVPLAALYNGHVPLARGRTTVIVLSGGNIDVNVISRIIERGLAKDGRLVRLQVQLHDEPGALANLLLKVSQCRVNVIEVHHNRAFNEVGLAEVHVELTLETRGRDHVEELKSALAHDGYTLGDFTGGHPTSTAAGAHESDSC